MPSIEENKKIAGQFMNLMSNGDGEGLMNLLSEDLEYWMAGSLNMSGTHTKADIGQMFQAFASVFPEGLKLSPRAMTAEGDRVAVEAFSKGTTAAGKTYANEYHFLFRINDAGKIYGIREYNDTLHVAEVLQG